jgi:flagellar hook-associated protein 1 FlgK
MGLSSALATAMSGLRSTQASLSIISSNVANAQTPGYVAQNANQIEVVSGDVGSSVRTTGVNRQLDLFAQSQLRTETSGAGYTNQVANILGQLQSVYGTPGSDGTLENSLNNFTTALQSLSSSPSNQSSQSVALSAAQSLAQQLNSTTQGIQSLRSNVEQDIGSSVTKANGLLTQIAQYNSQLQGRDSTDPLAATLADQRDNAINQLAQYTDVRVVTDPGSNQVNLFTNTGIQLVGGPLASQFQYSSPGALNATSLYSSNPTQNGVGTLSIKLPNGAGLDVVANNVVSSGQIAADLKLRDQTLVQAQTQVDQLAATMSSALSDKTTAGTAVAGPPAGFDVGTSGLLDGNTINLTYTDSSNVQRQVNIVNVSDPSALPLKNGANANPSYIGVDFSAGMSSVVSQLNTALGGAHLQFSNPSGSTLRITDDGTSQASVKAASATTTAQTLASGDAQLPLFTDGNSLYTGSIKGTGSQMAGLAGRIQVNTALLADPTKLSTYSTSPATAAGDATRPSFLFSQLTQATFNVSPTTGLGSAAQPFKGTVSSYLQQFISQQGNASTLATQLQQGQSVVVATLQSKFNSTSAVNIDTEMSNLIQVQNTYAANAHIMSVVQSMMQTLLQANP